MIPTITQKQTNRPSEVFSMNETQFDLTTARALATTGNSVSDTLTDEITNRPSKNI